jgi:hypothetical protein
MRIAHIIIAHKYPMQLERLVKRLQHPNSDIYIHIDRKTDITDFQNLSMHPSVRFVKKRIKVNWGGNSTLLAMTNSLLEAICINPNYEFINLVSGQDYPLQSAQKLYDFFLKNKGHNFISYDESKESAWWQAAAARYERYHFTDSSIQGKYLIQKIINWVFPSRQLPENLQLHGSSKSAWWTISGECGRYIASEISSNKSLIRFLKYCWGTDEFAVASLIMNSKFRHTTINNNLRYIDWSEGNAHPKLLTIVDIPMLIQSNALFARKFDENTDSGVLDYIDEILHTEKDSL